MRFIILGEFGEVEVHENIEVIMPVPENEEEGQDEGIEYYYRPGNYDTRVRGFIPCIQAPEHVVKIITEVLSGKENVLLDNSSQNFGALSNNEFANVLMNNFKKRKENV